MTEGKTKGRTNQRMADGRGLFPYLITPAPKHPATPRKTLIHFNSQAFLTPHTYSCQQK
jgi:hypothetical protein